MSHPVEALLRVESEISEARSRPRVDRTLRALEKQRSDLIEIISRDEELREKYALAIAKRRENVIA